MQSRPLPVRLRRLVTPLGVTTHGAVRCPRSGSCQDLTRCFDCPELVAFASDTQGGAVTCSIPPEKPLVDARADTSEVVTRTALHEVSSSVTAVTPDVTFAELRRVFAEHRLRSAVVVDPEGKLQGIVSRSDLCVAPIDGVVGDIMPSEVHALPEDAPLGFAVALMATGDISEVPIVTEDGVPTGICRSLDVIRWLAGRLGYVVHAPAPRDPSA